MQDKTQEIGDSEIQGTSPDINESDIAGPSTSLAPLPGVPAPSNVGFLGESGKQLQATGAGLKNLLIGPGAGIQDVAKGAFEGFVKAPGRELLGQPQPGKSALSAPQGAYDRIAGALDTFLGGDPGAGRMNALAGNPGAAAADWLTLPLATLGASKLSKLLPKATESAAGAESRVNALTRAAGVGKEKAIDFPGEFRAALPELDKTITAGNIDPSKITMPQFSQVVKDTFDRTNRDFNNRLGPIANQQVMPQSVIDELRSYKVGNPVEPWQFERNQAIDNAIARWSRPMNYGAINEQRMLARDQISEFHKMNPSTAGSKLGSNTNMAINHAIEDATKDLIYDKLQNTYAGQVPDNYFRNLKRTQSALYNITDQVKGRLNSLSNDEAQTFLTRLRPHTYVSSGGHVGAAVGNLANALFPESAAAKSNLHKGLTSRITDLRPLLLGSVPPLARHEEPSLAPEEK